MLNFLESIVIVNIYTAIIMWGYMKSIPNYLSCIRLILSVWLILVKPLSWTFFIVYLICGLTDVIDGYIARKYGVESRFGEKLDSAADLIMTAVLIIVLYPILSPGKKIIIWIILIAIIRFASILITFIKYKCFAIPHTYGNKITGFALFVIPICVLFIDTTVLLSIVCAFASISAVEELVIQITSKELDANRKSIFLK